MFITSLLLLLFSFKKKLYKSLVSSLPAEFCSDLSSVFSYCIFVPMRPNSSSAAAEQRHQEPPPQRLKAPPRTLFSCAFFRNCSHPSLSPTSPSPPPLPSPHAPPPPSPPPPPPSSSSSSSQPPPPPTKKLSSSSSSSSSASTSQSFTQWKFPLPSSPPPPPPPPSLPLPPSSDATLPEAFHAVELHLSSSNPRTQLSAFHVLERALPSSTNHDRSSSVPPVVTCPHSLMHAVVSRIRDGHSAPGVRRSAAKILLSLCLAEPNRRVAVEAGAVGAVIEGAVEMAEEGAAAAERALAALELICTVREGADEVRGHALAVPAMVGVMGRVEGRGREHAMGVLAVAFGGGGSGRKDHAPTIAASTVLAEEVAKAVELALKGECSERGRRKGKQLLKLLRELNNDGNKDDEADGCRASLSRDSDVIANYA